MLPVPLPFRPNSSPHPGDSGGGVDEDRLPASTLLSLVESSEGLIDGKGLSIEDLLVSAQVETVPSRPIAAADLSRAVSVESRSNVSSGPRPPRGLA